VNHLLEPAFEVIAAGILTTVQDSGRPGFGHLGVPRGGAADPWSLAVANLVLGNLSSAAALECTIVGPELRVLRPTVIALGGADLGAIVRPSGRRLAPGMSHSLAAGEILVMPGGSGEGARAYLAVPGGLDVPVVLGSRSTCLAAGFGGLDGRPLRAGDRLVQAAERGAGAAGRTWVGEPAIPDPDRPVRILAGPQLAGDSKADARAGAAALDVLITSEWTVDPASDRQGLRLVGSGTKPALGRRDAGARLSHGVVPGTIQLPPDGRPIVLLADAQPTGGYSVLGVVISADLPIVGQLSPGAAVRFNPVTLADATAAWTAQQSALAAGSRRLTAGADWDELWRGAGG
jgi:antagonist of KipI